MKAKKGIELWEGATAVMALILIAILVIVGIYSFTALGDSLVQTSTVTDEAGWVNSTGYTLKNTSACSFDSLSLTSVTNNSVLPTANYTMIGNKIYNGTSAAQYNGAKISYTYVWGGDGCNAASDTSTQFMMFPAAIGFIGTAILLGLVIGVLVMSFMGRSRKP